MRNDVRIDTRRVGLALRPTPVSTPSASRPACVGVLGLRDPVETQVGAVRLDRLGMYRGIDLVGTVVGRQRGIVLDACLAQHASRGSCTPGLTRKGAH